MCACTKMIEVKPCLSTFGFDLPAKEAMMSLLSRIRGSGCFGKGGPIASSTRKTKIERWHHCDERTVFGLHTIKYGNISVVEMCVFFGVWGFLSETGFSFRDWGFLSETTVRKFKPVLERLVDQGWQIIYEARIEAVT